MPRFIQVVVPDLGLAGRPLRVTAWHAAAGQSVVDGDRLVEISADHVTVDLPAPASGRLVRRLVAADDPVTIGQSIATLECDENE